MLRYLVDGGPYVAATLSELEADQRSGQWRPEWPRFRLIFSTKRSMPKLHSGFDRCAADEIGVEDEPVNLTVADAIARGIPHRLAARRR